MPTTLVSLRIDNELLEYLKERAEQEHRSLSNMIISILLEDAVYNSRTNKKHDDDIVRCKDCKYAVLTYQGELKYCKYFIHEYGFTNGGDPLYLEGDFFCAAGERR